MRISAELQKSCAPGAGGDAIDRMNANLFKFDNFVSDLT